MELKRVGTMPSIKGPESSFTVQVRMEMLNTPPAPARASCVSVTFEPGARSAWHTHPLGQTLIVTAGCGWTQCAGGPIVEKSGAENERGRLGIGASERAGTPECAGRDPRARALDEFLLQQSH